MSQSARSLAQSRALRRIVDPVRRLCAIDMPEPERWARISEVLEAALADPDLQTAARSWPKSHDRTNNRYTNLLFYEDPDFGFVINGLVKDETGRTPVHDHGHAWVAYGLLEGAETVLRYRDPAPEGAAASGLEPDEQLSGGSSESRTIEPDEQISLAASEVDLVPPWTFHAEQAETERTVAVMVRSAGVGKFAHRRLNPDTGETYNHPGPHQIPYEL